MKLIQTTTLGTAAASIEFTSIPQIFTDVVILVSARSSQASNTESLRFNVNGVGPTNTQINLIGSGTAASSQNLNRNEVPAGNFTANTFGNMSIYITNYTASGTKNLSFDAVSENNASTADLRIIAQNWASVGAVSSIRMDLSSGNLVASTTISLYGITKGSDGITTAS